MAELLLDLFCEEIPAGIQARAAHELVRLLEEALTPLKPRNIQHFHSPRRISAILKVEPHIPTRTLSERGPRENAPEKALAGFTRKYGVTPADLVKENGFWMLKRELPAIRAEQHIKETLPELLWKFPWPKAMRWGNGSLFTWVRPLRHITCLLDATIVPFALSRNGDDAHGLVASNKTEGHRFLSPGIFIVKNATHWRQTLEARHVILDACRRKELIRNGVHQCATDKGLQLVEDKGLVDEVSGLVEYPVPFLGQIDAEFMDLPPEVMQVSMRVNQRYFALRTAEGKAAPYFAFVANRNFSDDGALSIAGNERVLRARFADARHFWILDRKIPLAQRVTTLASVTFHARLGTQEERAQRIASLAGKIAKAMGLNATECTQAERAGLLSKADLTTGMVGEFPELQGIMGGYYAAHDGENTDVARAIAEHYMPRGQSDETTSMPLSIAVAIADRLDMLASFFSIGETPSGSGDPYGLRRAALGIIRTVRDNALRIDLGILLTEAAKPFAERATEKNALEELEAFFTERLKVQLRHEGRRHDVLDATLAARQKQQGTSLFTRYLDGDLVRLLSRVDALSETIVTEEGKNLLAAYRRAANILRIENRKDGPHNGTPDPTLYEHEEEQALDAALHSVITSIQESLAHDHFAEAMHHLSRLRTAMDHFFNTVTVNAKNAGQRRNRLCLLAAFCNSAAMIADFGKIEG